MQKISIHYIDIKSRIQNAGKIKAFVPIIFSKENYELQHTSFIFCSDEYLLQINKRFLQHNYYTDIITFPLHQKNAPVLGEIYISAERVKENAKMYGSTIQNEFLRIIFHGTLHLCGYIDNTKKHKQDRKSVV